MTRKGRNPYGLTMARDGSLYTSNLDYDDSGVRAVKGCQTVAVSFAVNSEAFQYLSFRKGYRTQ